MKMSKTLACLMSMVFIVFSLTTVAFASDDGMNDDGSICLDDEEYISDEDLEVYIPDDGCYCGGKPCVTTAPEPETKPVTTVKSETKPVTKKPSETKPKVTEKKPAVTTVSTTEPKPIVTSAPEATKPVTTSAPEATKPVVTTTTPAATSDPEKEPSSTEGGSLDLGGMFSDLLEMFGDMDFELGDLGGYPMGGFGTDTPLTPDGNMSLVDDIFQDESYDEGEKRVIQSKQFITVQTKSGNSFYIIIDRSKDGENVYFLNLVDESDLLALMEDAPEAEAPAEPEKPAECICKDKDKCELGVVNAECEVCKMDLTKCSGKEKPKDEVKPDGTEKESPKKEKRSVNPALLLLPVIALAGGGAYWFFKIRKPKSKNVHNPDDYDFEDSADYGEAEDIDETENTEDNDTDMEEDA